MNIELGNTATPRGKLIPNPKAKLQEQFHEVARFKYLSERTEETYWVWIRQFILFHGKRHPREMGKPEIESFLSHLASVKNVAVSTQNQALNAVVLQRKTSNVQRLTFNFEV